jgi:hypothetical protein
MVFIKTIYFMKANKDWVPTSRDKLHRMVSQCTIPVIDRNRTRFGMESGTPLGGWYSTEFILKGYDPFAAAFNKWTDPEKRTPLVVTTMKETEKTFIPYLRELRKLMTANPLVTDVDLESMEFPKRPDGSRTPSPVATESPEFDLTPLVGHRLQVNYYRRGSRHKKGKPKGQHGVEIKWGFSETPALGIDVLAHSIFDTATPLYLGFQGHEGGRMVYIAMRWENTRGEKGPWSPIEGALVP